MLKRRLTANRGAAMVEVVLLLPIVLLVMFAIVELSRAWFTLQVATAAAREGVRAAAVAPLVDVTTVGNARIDQVLAAGNVTPVSRSVVSAPIVIPGVTTTDQQVLANVQVQFDTIFPALLPASLQSMTITQTAAMRHEGG